MAGQGTICPRCKQRGVSRCRRKTWMRLIPWSKHFECDNCDARFLSIFGGIMKLPLTRPRKARGVLPTESTFLTPSPGKGRGHGSGKVRKFLTPVTVSLVILALGSFMMYQGFGGKAVQEISQKFLQVLRLASTPQDRPAVLPVEVNSPAAPIPAEVAPAPESKSLATSSQPSQRAIKKGESLHKIIAQHYPKNQQIGLVAIMLANPEISKDYLIYAGQVLKLPQLDPTDKIIKLQDNLYYSLYGSYNSDKDLKKHTPWLAKKKIKFKVINAKDMEKKNVYLVVLGGYEKRDDLQITRQSIKTKSE